MRMDAQDMVTSISVEGFWESFPEDGLGPLPRSREVAEGELPGPYRALLAHNRHMTVALEERHGPVAISVLSKRLDGSVYRRRTLLVRAGTRVPVLLGAVRLDLDALPPRVRREILRQEVPLGRILITNEVLRRV